MCAVHLLTHLFECCILICESEEIRYNPQTNDKCCHLCREMHTNHFNGPELLLCVSTHILHDSQVKDADNPCGLCVMNAVMMWVGTDRVAMQNWNVAQILVHGTGLMVSECKASRTQWSWLQPLS